MTDIQEKTNEAEKEKIRTILLIGNSGSGKSTLGNVLINRNGNFEKVFVEGEYNVSETKNINSARVEIEGINYNIVDTPGFDDTSLEVTKIPPTLGKLDEHIRLGIDYVLFTVGKKFTNKDLNVFKYLKEIFFEDDVVKYITIIFTNFPKFREKERCGEAIEKLRNESESIADIINNMNIIHVNNATPLDDEDTSAKRAREDSRKRILDHLKLYRNEEKCKPRSGDLHERIKILNETELTEKKKYHNEIGEWVNKLKIFIEWRKKIEEDINNYLETLVLHVKRCEVSAGKGRNISLVGRGVKSPIGSVISVTGQAYEFGSRFTEIIIEGVYYHMISKKAKEDKEKRLMLLREELRSQINEYHGLLNMSSTDIIENLSFQSLILNIRTALNKICTLVEERRIECENSESNEINMTDHCESVKAKSFFVQIIYKAKILFISKLQEDNTLLEAEGKYLQKTYKESEDKVKELEAKLEKENLAFLSKAKAQD